MQLASRDGIACDKCSMQHKLDFTYYSFDFHPVLVHDPRVRPSTSHILQTTPVLSVDICEKCYDEYAKQVITCNKSTTQYKCELSGVPLGAEYKYCEITKAVVRMSSQPLICNACKRQVTSTDTACKCGGSQFSRLADISTTKRLLEFAVCPAEFDKFVYAAEIVRKVAGNWDTRT